MSVRISSKLTDEHYGMITEAIKKGQVVRILDEEKMDPPINYMSPVLVNPQRGTWYYIDSYLCMGSEEEVSAAQNCAMKKLKKDYDLDGAGSDFVISTATQKYRMKKLYDGGEDTLKLNSFKRPAEDGQLKSDITQFIKILETVIDSAYETYDTNSNKELRATFAIHEQTEERHETSEKTDSEKKSPIKALEYIPRKNNTFSFNDIGGCENAKESLLLIAQGIEHPEILKEWGAKQPTGILFYGPPGTGKTLLAKAAAKEINANFYRVILPEITSMWYGESEKNAREVFSEARKNTPSILFFDEIDTIASSRENSSEPSRRVLNTLLQEMDGMKGLNSVTIIGATNRLYDLDIALLRPGRFDQLIEVPLPDINARKEIYSIRIKGRKIAKKNLSEDIDYDTLSKLSDGFSGADINGVIENCINGKRTQIRTDSAHGPICTDDLVSSIEKYKALSKRLKGAMSADASASLYA